MSNSITPLRIAMLLLACGLGMSQTAALTPPRSEVQKPPQNNNADSKTETAEAAESDEMSERAALELVHRHLPQLTKLLETLRRDSPEQYRRAVTDLARQARRLEASRLRDPQLFEIELNILKRQTRVDLCVARLQLRDDPKTRSQLRQAISDLQQSRRRRLVYERDHLQQRTVRIEQQLQAVEERLEAPIIASPEWVDKTFRNLLRKAGRSSGRMAGSDEVGSEGAKSTDGTADRSSDENETDSTGNLPR